MTNDPGTAPDPGAGAVPDPGAVQEPGPDVDHVPESPSTRSRRNRMLVRLVGAIILVSLVYYSVFIVLPSEVSWAQLAAAFSALTIWQLAALVAAGLVVIATLGWGSKASLPGLTLYQGTESSVTSQMSAFVMPPPGDMVIRFAMYRTYGYSDERSASAVLIAMIGRYLAIGALPVLGMAAVLITGQGSTAMLVWLVGCSAVLIAATILMLRVVGSEGAAEAVGGFIQRLLKPLLLRLHQGWHDDVQDAIVRFGERTRQTVEGNGRVLVVANLSWALANALLMLLCVRFAGLAPSDLDLAMTLLAAGLVMALDTLPIPGKDVLAASLIAGILMLTEPDQQAAFTVALLLYRTMSWLMPMPIGGVAYFVWRARVRRGTASTDSSVPTVG